MPLAARPRRVRSADHSLLRPLQRPLQRLEIVLVYPLGGAAKKCRIPSGSDSEIATSVLKRKKIYPDSTGDSDAIAFAYNRQQQVILATDQGGTVHAYDYDKLGRQTQDRITTLGSGVDGAVRRIATMYEVRGMKAKLTSYDNPTVGSGTVVNDVQFAYNDFAQLTTDYQSHSGAVNVSTTPKVQYGYASGSTNTIRPTTLTYPNGRVLTFSYGTWGGISDHASRVASLIDNDGTTHLVDYDYLGRGTFVIADDTQPDVKWTLVDLSGSNDPDTGDIYRGLDRFGRVKDNRWYDYGASTDVDRIKYGYDRAGNRIWRENVVATSLSKAFDELYSYDGIHRLQDMQRGTLNSGHTALTSETFAQCWTLDATGNWSGFRQDDTGDGTWDLVQARTANTVNEITDITNSVGSAWVDPAYSPAGNMTTLPQPNDPTQSYTATYDAWNRLVKLAAGANTVSEYAYDGAKRRVIQMTYSGGSLSETRHLYYTQPSQWQVVEERVGSSSNAQRQFVWGLRYIDDCVLRDRDTGSGPLDERIYACQDANWNVDALIDTAGDVQERYAYSAYGESMFLTAGFVAQSASNHDWESLYCGYRFETATVVFHVRHRVYIVPLGNWGQRDALSYLDGSNLYRYVMNSPTTLVDPSGLLLGYGYGNFCGFSRNPGGMCPAGTGPKKPIDAVDAACERHDCCLNRLRDCWKVTSCNAQLCSEVWDAYFGGCQQSYRNDPAKVKDCKTAACTIAGTFCWLSPCFTEPGGVSPGW